jgi:hypothetical protein
MQQQSYNFIGDSFKEIGDAVSKVVESFSGILEKLVEPFDIITELLPLIGVTLDSHTDPSGPGEPFTVGLQSATTLNLDLSAFGYTGLGGGIVYTPASPITSSTVEIGPIGWSMHGTFLPGEFVIPQGYELVGVDFIAVAQGVNGQMLVSDPIHAQLSTPEPSTITLFGIGTFALLSCAWRRRKAVETP